MRIIVVSSLLCFSISGFASPLCQYFYGPQKQELSLVYSALNAHVTKKEISDDLVHKSILKFIEIMDPYKFLFSKQDLVSFVEISTADLALLKKELISSSTRKTHAYIQQMAFDRLMILVDGFATKKEFRDEVERRMNMYETNHELKPDLGERVQDSQQALGKFFDYFAIHALNYKINADKPLTDREALVMAIRSFRNEITKDNYVYQTQMLPYLISKSLIDSLDAHSSLSLGSEHQNMYKMLYRTEFSGLGVGLLSNIKGIKLMEVHAGSGAEMAGLKSGDIITHVKVTNTQKDRFGLPLMPIGNPWLPIRGLDQTRVIDELLIGEPDTSVTLRILRDKTPIEVNVQRRTISKNTTSLHSEMHSTPQGPVAYIKLDAFYAEAGQHMHEIIKNFKKQGASGMILDLRNNGGGSVLAFQNILGFFIRKGPAMLTKSGDGRAAVLPIIEANPGSSAPLWDKPLIVLVNRFSASASELLSGALKDYGRAIIIGEDISTFGKGSMQNVAFLGPNASTRITTSLISSPTGGHRQFDGVVPDIVIKSAENTDFKFERDLDNAIPPDTIDRKFRMPKPFIPNKNRLMKDMEALLGQPRNQDQPSTMANDKTLGTSILLMGAWMSQN